jgi:hypothetical protein
MRPRVAWFEQGQEPWLEFSRGETEGALINYFKELNMAERKRFELLRGLLLCTLSKGVPSTTRPSLRETYGSRYTP